MKRIAAIALAASCLAGCAGSKEVDQRIAQSQQRIEDAVMSDYLRATALGGSHGNVVPAVVIDAEELNEVDVDRMVEILRREVIDNQMVFHERAHVEGVDVVMGRGLISEAEPAMTAGLLAGLANGAPGAQRITLEDGSIKADNHECTYFGEGQDDCIVHSDGIFRGIASNERLQQLSPTTRDGWLFEITKTVHLPNRANDAPMGLRFQLAVDAVEDMDDDLLDKVVRVRDEVIAGAGDAEKIYVTFDASGKCRVNAVPAGAAALDRVEDCRVAQ